MENCLKTTLKATVSSASLPRLGELLFDVSNIGSTRVILATGDTAWQSKFVAENVTMLYAANDVQYDELAIAGSGSTGAKFTNLQSNSRVRITDKYNIRYLSCSYYKPLFSLKEIKSLNENLSGLVLSITDIEGDIMDLVNFSKMTELGLNGTNVTGDVTAFLNAQAQIRANGSTLALYVGSYVSNVPAGIGTTWATRGVVTFDGNGSYTIGTP